MSWDDKAKENEGTEQERARKEQGQEATEPTRRLPSVRPPLPAEPTRPIRTVRREDLQRALEEETDEETFAAAEPPTPAEPTRLIRTVRREELPPAAAETPPPAEPTRAIPTMGGQGTRPPQERHPHPEEESQETSGAEPTRYLRAQPQQRSDPHAETRRVQPQQRSDPHAETRRVQPQQRSDPNAETRRVQPQQRQAGVHDAGTRPVTPPPHRPPPPSTPPGHESGTWASVMLTLTLVIVGLFLLGLVVGTVGYIYIASQLPPAEELRDRQLNFSSSRIFDRNNNLLYEIIDPTGGRRTYVPIEQIDRNLQLATVATEDRNFYIHTGFDPVAIARAVFYALQEREIVSGASTITQQVARNLLLEPEERTEQTARRKIREIVLASELDRRYNKEEILEIYLNNNNYGNLAYGIDAAARTYFGRSASNLTLAQAAFLAGLPQSPALYDPYHGGLDAALKRQRTVLDLMVEAGYITPAEAAEAAAEMENYDFEPIATDRIPAAHFVFYVRQWVEQTLGTEALYRGSGLRIYTTLDQRLQSIAEEEVAQGVANLVERNVSNGALVALEPATGNILAMVGSADFYNTEIDGQVNVTTRCRQPGSAIKPLTYLAAFERAWTPATIIWDLPVTYTDTAGNVYKPVNFDGEFRGPVSVRTALANSMNIPAVKALEYVTVDGLLEMAERLGATSIVTPQLECPDYPYDARPLYGLALTLGGGEMKPLELTAAYGTFANAGHHMPPTPILWIEDNEGNVLVDNRQRAGEQVLDAEQAYLITDILSDTETRCLVFRCPSILELPNRPVAAKTGTTNDNRDAWTVGYTPDLVAGVWVGNNDNSEMAGIGGSTGAGPIWHNFMARALENTPVHDFPRPQGVVEQEICALSGVQPSPYCPERRREVFAKDNLPPDETYDWIQRVEIDTMSGKRANQFCRANLVERVMVVLDWILDPAGREWMRRWAAEHGYEIAPREPCTAGVPSDQVRITSPQDGAEVYGRVEVRGTVNPDDLERFELFYGYSDNPLGWGLVSGPYQQPIQDGLLGVWDTTGLEPHLYTLRVVAYTKDGEQLEGRVVVEVVGPTPTPTPETTPTHTPTVTPTPTATGTATPTPTPTIEPVLTEPIIIGPTETTTPEPPTATPTPEPEPPGATPTETPIPPTPTETPAG